MKTIVLTAVGVLALVSGASAQEDETVWLSTQGGKQMIVAGPNTDGSELIIGTGAKPAYCPTGHYYTTDSLQQMVMKCDDDTRFSLSDPQSGATMRDGQPYPSGSKILTPAL